MAKRRFELRVGSSSKFWEINLAGTKHTVCYGRIGTNGQTKTKDHGSVKKAKDAAVKLIATKLSKGYLEAGATKSKAGATKSKAGATKSKAGATKPKAGATKPKAGATKSKAGATKGKATKPAPAATVAPDLVIKWDYSKGFVAVWRDTRDVWIVGIDDPPKQLPSGTSIIALLKADGFVERWRFATTKETMTALKGLKAQNKKAARLPSYVEADFEEFAKQLKEKNRQRLARFAVAKSGPVTLRRHQLHEWLLPRPPSHCSCGRVMMPTFALSGAIDSRLGKNSYVYVSYCPGGTTDYCETTTEVIVQVPDHNKPQAEHYFLSRKSYQVVVEGLLWNAIENTSTIVITRHFGEQGENGTHLSKHFRKRKEADQYLKSVLREAGKPVEVAKFGKWYRDILAEIHAFHRVNGAESKTLKLKPIVPPMQVSGTDYTWSRALFDNTDTVGGQPAFTQSDWWRRFPCPRCKTEMLFIFQAGSGAPWWSPILNDGDAGSFQFFACAKCRGPWGQALFESH